MTGRSRKELCDALGKSVGEMVFDAIRGVDKKKIESDKPRKSVSAEINVSIYFDIVTVDTHRNYSMASVSRIMSKQRSSLKT